MKNTIQVGIGCKEEHLKSDGDILFATPEADLLISGDTVYLNGKPQTTIDKHGVAVIVDAFRTLKPDRSVGDMDADDQPSGRYGCPPGADK